MRQPVGKLFRGAACAFYLILSVGLSACATPASKPHLAAAQPILNVADFGAVSGDLTADNTVAFQTALNAAAKQGGGMVMVPVGRYAFQGTLMLPHNVILAGATTGPFDPAQMPAGHSPADGPTGTAALLVMKQSSAPFILVPGYNSAVTNLLFYYPNQVQPDDAGVDRTGPTPYPPTIRTVGVFRISGCSFTNSYIGIAVDGGRTWIDNLNIGAYKIGITVDDSADFNRISHVLIHPFWDSWTGRPRFPQPIDKWVFNNGHGIDLGRCDGILIEDYSTFFRSVGLFLTKGRNGGVTFGNASNLQLDTVKYGILAYATDTGLGFTVTNGYMDAVGGPQKAQTGIASQSAICVQQEFPGARSLISVSGGSINPNEFAQPIMVAPGAGTVRLNAVVGLRDQVVSH